MLSRKSWLVGILIVVAVVLAAEIVLVAPRVLDVWHPWDYGNYVKMGLDVREGRNPYGPDRYYPLPTMLWIFVPLSLMPAWFALPWVIVPFVFILILFRGQGAWFFLFPPLWFVVSDAMFDGWLLLPLAWLLANRPIWAGVGAALLLFKPHVTVLVVGYMLWRWVIARDWKNLKTFSAAMALLWLPSFIVNPGWLWQMLEVLQTRTEQISILPLLTASIWSWAWLGGMAQTIFLAVLMATGVLFWRAARDESSRAAAFQLVGLLLNPVMLASNLILVLPTVRGRNQIVGIVFVALGGYALDRALGAFGGGYALVSLFALYFLARQSQTTPIKDAP